ncbi:MAG TPA: phospholipase D-like domain-containing protein [Gammaproteobacteria bacterium]
MQPGQFLATALAAIGFVAAAAASLHALLHKRRPQSAFGWIALCFTLPLAGALLYYLFGINRVEIRARKLLTGHPALECPTEYVGTPPPALLPLSRLGFAVSGWPLTAANRVELLHDAAAIFDAMIAAIEAAREYVYFSTYIFDGGALGRRFAVALAAAAERGADVRVLLDGVGEWYSWERASDLFRGTRVRFARFLPPRIWPPTIRVNLRNHRKILVVDGDAAFTGGINVRDRYLDGAEGERIVDSHCRITGPVVTQIETVFLRDWQFTTADASSAPRRLSQPAGDALCRAIADGPDSALDRLTTLITGAIGSARRRVAIMTPYFVPPRELVAPLQAAALAGIDVAVILPARNNLPYVHRATRHMLWELLQRGVHVYYQPPPFVHSKLFYVDDYYAQVGSANFDARSLRLNFELNVEVFDRDTVTSLASHFEAIRARSLRLTLEDVDKRPVLTKAIDGVAWLFSPYL